MKIVNSNQNKCLTDSTWPLQYFWVFTILLSIVKVIVFEPNYLNVLINLHLNQELLAKLPQDLSFHSSLLPLRHDEKEKSKKKRDKNSQFFTHKEHHKYDRQLHLLIDCSVNPANGNIGTHAKIPGQQNPNRVAADLLSNTGKTSVDTYLFWWDRKPHANLIPQRI